MARLRVQDLRRRRKPCGASCNSCGRRVSIQTASCARLSKATGTALVRHERILPPVINRI
jgi:hypothetical protein